MRRAGSIFQYGRAQVHIVEAEQPERPVQDRRPKLIRRHTLQQNRLGRMPLMRRHRELPAAVDEFILPMVLLT
jgi:hypothetical protein